MRHERNQTLFLDGANNAIELGDARPKHLFGTPSGSLAPSRPVRLGHCVETFEHVYGVVRATKFLDGQGRCVGGAVVAPAAMVKEKFFPFLRTAGPSMSPFNAWVFLKGLETLTLRMDAHSRHAGQLAEFLEQHPRVSRVFYPGLASHPQHALAARQQSGFGGVVSFEVKGGRTAAWRMIDSLKLFSITANLGDTRSIVTHPATTTHGRLAPAQRAAMGIMEDLVRLSVGLEAPSDLIRDLSQALEP